MTTREQISEWFDAGTAACKTHMLVVCVQMDMLGQKGFAFRPHYCDHAEECRDAIRRYSEMQGESVIEVYDLAKDRDEQVAQNRVWNVPAC